MLASRAKAPQNSGFKLCAPGDGRKRTYWDMGLVPALTGAGPCHAANEAVCPWNCCARQVVAAGGTAASTTSGKWHVPASDSSQARCEASSASREKMSARRRSACKASVSDRFRADNSGVAQARCSAGVEASKQLVLEVAASAVSGVLAEGA